MSVEGYNSDGAEFMVCRKRRYCPLRFWRSGRPRRNRVAALSKCFFQFLPAPFSKKKGWIDELQSLLLRESICAFACEHDVRRLLHHRSRQRDRMASASDSCHGSRIESRAIHDRCIEFIASGRSKHGAASGIEERIIFHEADRGLDGI